MQSLLSSLLLLLFLFVFSGSVIAQSSNYELLDRSTMQIDGTSTIHDWTSDVEEININFDFNASALTPESDENPVTSLTLTVPVEEIESGKGRMNGKMYDALKKDDHPNIRFELSSAEVTETASAGSSFTLNTTGTLNVAGVSKEINFPVEGSVGEDGDYTFTGSYELNMRDYDVDPPSAMFGTIKSGEMVTISFELFFSEQ